MLLDELNTLDNPAYQDGDPCPNCEDGTLIEKYERRLDGEVFLGCSNFPRCQFSHTLDLN